MARNMVKVTKDNPKTYTMHEIPQGCLFIGADGQVWIRTFDGAASLVDGGTYPPLFDVIPLAPGAEVTITQPEVNIGPTWRSRNGTVQRISEMATPHLVNALRVAENECRPTEATAIRHELRRRGE